MQKPTLRYITALLLFGSNGIVAAHIALPSIHIVLARTLLGSILLCAVLGANLIRNAKRPACLTHPKQALFLALSGTALGCGWIFLFEAYRLIGVSIASLAYYCGPILVMALSPILFRSKLTLRTLIGFAVVVVGATLVVGQASAGPLSPLGLLYGALSALMYAAMVIFSKKATDICGLENAAVQLVCASLAVFAFSVLSGQALPVISSSDIAPALMLGLINTGLGCYLYFSALHDLPVQTVSVLGYLEPLSAVILSVVILHEPMSLWQAVGAALILGGAAWCELGNKKEDTVRAHKPLHSIL